MKLLSLVILLFCHDIANASERDPTCKKLDSVKALGNSLKFHMRIAGRAHWEELLIRLEMLVKSGVQSLAKACEEEKKIADRVIQASNDEATLQQCSAQRKAYKALSGTLDSMGKSMEDNAHSAKVYRRTLKDLQAHHHVAIKNLENKHQQLGISVQEEAAVLREFINLYPAIDDLPNHTFHIAELATKNSHYPSKERDSHMPLGEIYTNFYEILEYQSRRYHEFQRTMYRLLNKVRACDGLSPIEDITG